LTNRFVFSVPIRTEHLRAVILLLIPLFSTHPCRASDRPEHVHLALKASLSSLYDSNVHRAYRIDNENKTMYTDKVSGDVAARMILQGLASFRTSTSLRGNLAYTVGFKKFARFTDEDVLVNKLEAGVWANLGTRSVMGLYGSFKDKDQRGREEVSSRLPGARDYRRGGAGIRATTFAGPLRFNIGAGYSFLDHKPREFTPYSNQSYTISFESIYLLAKGEFRIKAGYYFSRLFYKGMAYTEKGNTISEMSVHRKDSLHVLEASTAWHGPLLIEVGYRFWLNQSNSAGETFQAHSVRLTLSADLFANVGARLICNLKLKKLVDGFYLSGVLPLAEEDENQNSVLAVLDTDLSDDISVELGFAYYGNELSKGGYSFSRSLAFLSMTGKWGN